MMRILRIFSVFFILILIASCSSTKVSVEKVNDIELLKKYSPVRYGNFYSSLSCADFSYLDSNKESPVEYFLLAKGVNQIFKGNYAQADTILTMVMNYSTNDTLKNIAGRFLKPTLSYQKKWKEYLNVDYDPNDTLRNKFSKVMTFDKAPNEEVIYNSLPDTLELSYTGGTPEVKVQINGKEYYFLFDTGCDITCISSDVIEETNSIILDKFENGIIASTGTKSDMTTGCIQELKIGKNTIKNHPVIIADESNMKIKFLFIRLKKIDGLIGWNAIRNYDVVMDYKNDRIILAKPEKKDQTNRNLFWMEYPIVKIKTTNGTPLIFGFDSGAKYSSCYDILLRKLPMKDLDSTNEKYWGVGGWESLPNKIIPRFNILINDYCVKYQDIRATNYRYNMFLVLDGILGSDIIKKKSVHFDITNGIFEFID